MSATAKTYAQFRLHVMDALPRQIDEHLIYASRVLPDDSGVPVDVVKAILRDLRNDGLARLSPCVNQDDYTPCGSGYALTEAGEKERDALNKEGG